MQQEALQQAFKKIIDEHFTNNDIGRKKLAASGGVSLHSV